MSDDSETVEDTKKGILAEVTDDSCTLEFIEIVPLDRPSDDYFKPECIYPVVEVKPEDLQEVKQESADENDNVDSHCYVKQEPADENDNGDSHCYVKQEPADETDNGDSHCYVKQETAEENDNLDSHCYVKQEPADDYETQSSCFPVQVSSACTYSTDFYCVVLCRTRFTYTTVSHLSDHPSVCLYVRLCRSGMFFTQVGVLRK